MFSHIVEKKEIFPMGRLVIDGDNVYELDEECLREKRRENEKKEKNFSWDLKEKK